MPSYPLRPTFPIDVRSPSATVRVGRQGTAVTLDVIGGGGGQVTAGQFFAALEVMRPGASAIIQDAVPSDPGNAINRAYRTTAFVAPDCALLAFVKETLNLRVAEVSDLLLSAALQPK